MLRIVVVSILVMSVWGRTPYKKNHLIKNNIGRIVGGTETTIEAHPYQVSLNLNDGTDDYICGGSILDPKHILTAAHCMEDIKSIEVRAGSAQLDNGGVVFKTTKFKVHPKYNKETTNYDVAIIYLKKDLPLNDKTIKVVNLASSNTVLPVGTPVTVAGFGAIRDNGPTSDVLLEVTVKTLDKQKCADAYGTITPQMICAGVPEGGKDACEGDSGGPLMTQNGTQVGIVSFGYICADPKYPGVYSNVAALRKWIKENSGV